MADHPKREKLSIKTNLTYELKLLFNEPVTGEGEFGEWFLYAVEVVKAPAVDKDCTAGSEYSWFPSPYANDLVVKTGAKKGDILEVLAEQDGKKTRWTIARKDQPPSPNKPPPDFPAMRENARAAQANPVNRVEGPKPPEPGAGARTSGNGSGKVKHGWTRENLAEEVNYWIGLTLSELKEQANFEIPMPDDNICVFFNTALRQRLYGPPPEVKPVDKEIQAAPAIDLVGLWELVDDSLQLLHTAPDPVLIEAWPEKFKDLVRLLPDEQRERVKKTYRSLPK